ncbi:hypothetical protein ACFPVX_06325 [Cohnella faecalis]|uniref:Uncharacterized protein n=1 Tax=Cohnella faecalis TaxID=2315694 RepID=A0A398CIY9_9BACL|nr:hypothetical protein [Cohnella faecalis]RIE02052.1 hypothetical protein D3H35_14910 [Cohnella faecalis]
MIPELLWIIGFYAAAAALTHSVFRRHSGGDRRHYVLVAGNHQMQIEWYVRSLQQFSRRTGMDIGITVVLDNSSDDTGKIMERFARRGDGVGLIRAEEVKSSAEWERLRLGEASGPEEHSEHRGSAAEGAGGSEAGAGRKQVLSERLAALGALQASPQQVWVELACEDDVARLPR